MRLSLPLFPLLLFLILEPAACGPPSVAAQPTSGGPAAPDSASADPPGARMPGPAAHPLPAANLEPLAFDGAALDARAEELTDLVLAPVNLNTASVDELAAVPGLSFLLADRIVRTRREGGPFSSLGALRRLDGVSSTTIRRLRPYLRAGPAPPPRARDDRGETRRTFSASVLQRVGRRLDVGAGYAPRPGGGGYTGSPYRLATRLHLRGPAGPGRLSARAVLEKDPGEPLRWNLRRRAPGLDHASGTLAVEGLGAVESVVLGDYRTEFGQGLVFWGGGGFGKGWSPVAPALRSGRGIVATATSEENRFLRGAALTVRPRPGVRATAFVSRRRLDARLSDDGQAVLSFRRSGLHRTPGEQAGRDAVRERVLGGAAEWRRDGVRIGAAAKGVRYGRPLRRPDRPDARFAPAGARHVAGSLHARAVVGRAALFAEIGRTAGIDRRAGGLGAAGGVAFESGRHTDGVVSARVLPRRFYSLHGSAFGEQTGLDGNEVGVYVGLRHRLAPAWTLTGYVDQYRTPWLRYGGAGPSAGIDGRLRLEHRPRPWLTQSLSLRGKTQTATGPSLDLAGPHVRAQEDQTTYGVRWEGRYTVSRPLSLRSRIGIRAVRGPASRSENGLLVLQDILLRPMTGLQVDLRLAFFDTDSYAARLYAYEANLLYAFSIPALSGRGQRRYVLVRYAPSRAVRIEARYAVTRYRDRTVVGSGLDAVSGNRVRDVGLQVRWRLPA